MKQIALTIVTRIPETQVEALRAELDPAKGGPGARLLAKFAALPMLHFACLFIADATAALPACMVFEANLDGSADDFLEALLSGAGDDLDALYRYCADYPGLAVGGRLLVQAYLLRNDYGAATFFIGCPGRSVGEIRREASLYSALQTAIDDGLGAAANRAGDIIGTARAIRANPPGGFDWALEAPLRPFLARYGGLTLAALLAAILLLLVLLAGWLTPIVLLILLAVPIVAFLVALRRHELRDDAALRREPAPIMQAREIAILEQESRPGRVQNHLASVTYVKPGKFRLATLKAVLWAIDLLGRLIYNQGRLGKATGIHFARWTIIDDGRRLLFMSNFDGSWESYLDDFILFAAAGLTAVFSNTVGFPKTRFLIRGGARDEPRFKAFAAASQVPSLVWYSAYPDLTVGNIDNNTAMREGLSAELDMVAADAWLRRFSGGGLS